MRTIVIPEDFTPVYKGGHHTVWCNGKEHYKTEGGECETVDVGGYLITLNGDWPTRCDCEKFKEGKQNAM